MSEALYGTGGLRFWSEREIMLRDQFTQRIYSVLRDTLSSINKSWSFVRTEGPLITPAKFINPAYDENDVWGLRSSICGGDAFLRPETTASSYVVMDRILASGKHKMPLCVWQSGKSFRRETNDGASASKLRFFEFYQLELQCLYAEGTKADYITPAIDAVSKEVSKLTNSEVRIVPSDRLPTYSEQTTDIEAFVNDKWREMCSVSKRKDNKHGHVLEVAVGLDRLISICD